MVSFTDLEATEAETLICRPWLPSDQVEDEVDLWIDLANSLREAGELAARAMRELDKKEPET
jgi:hypothetical protein